MRNTDESNTKGTKGKDKVTKNFSVTFCVGLRDRSLP